MVAVSGFTLAGAPTAVPRALDKRAREFRYLENAPMGHTGHDLRRCFDIAREIISIME